MRARYGLGPDDFIDQGESGEIVADRWEISREELDAFSVDSHARAARATEEGRFAGEILPVAVVTDDGEEELFAADQGIRPGSTVEALAGLKPAFRPDGKLTAGNSSQISDGAAALLIMSAERAADAGPAPPRALPHLRAGRRRPDRDAERPDSRHPARARALRAGVDDIERFEVNEAFASRAAGVAPASSTPTPSGSTSTAGPSPWATPSGPPAHGS